MHAPDTDDPDHPIDGVPTPAPELCPAEAVDRQVDALERNDDPFEDAGVATAYNFASASNRRATGPYGRFRRMVHNRRYRPMVNHAEAVAGPVEREGPAAVRKVTVTGPGGRTVTYEFRLSTAATGPFRNCWVTDAVRVV